MKKFIIILFLIFISNVVFAETYTMVRGDTLTSVARKFGITVSELVKANNIKDPNKVYRGMKLVIPEKKSNSTVKTSQPQQQVQYNTYKIKKGDTLAKIASKNNTTVKAIMSVNKISNANRISVGQKLKIPVKVMSTVSNTTALPVTKPAVSNVSSKPAVNTESNPNFWPVEGTRQPAVGKMKGSVITTVKSSIIRSVSSGKVIYEGKYHDMGRVVFVEAKNAYIYIYGGNENTLVKVGDIVSPGSELGTPIVNADTGKANVFFSVTKDGIPIDENTAPRIK